MKNKKFNLKVKDVTSQAVNPSGVSGLSVSIEREASRVFFRKKLNGQLIFQKDDWKLMEQYKKDCCKVLGLTIHRQCSQNDIFIEATMNAKKFKWNNRLCEVTTQPEVTDIYKIFYKYWNKKINVLASPATAILEHYSRLEVDLSDHDSEKNRIIAKGGTYLESVYTADSTKAIWFKIKNNRARFFLDIVLYIIQKTFESTEISYIIPKTTAELSYFLTSDINICSGQKNQFKEGIFIDASDMLDPTSEQNATGLMASGKPNESMAISLKEILEELKTLADLEWSIDRETNKLKIEHSTYFYRGGKYLEDVIGLDLNNTKYKKSFKDYDYNYENDSEDLQVEEIKFSLNENINGSDKAYRPPINYENFTGVEKYNSTGFLKCDDFSFGNIRYDNKCEQQTTADVVTQTLTSSIIITHVEAVEFADTNVDASKWVLIDVEKKTGYYTIKAAKTDRLSTLEPIRNANFSATTLMRQFHRWNRQHADGYMNFNENAIAGTLTAKGKLRKMYSTKRTKLIDPITIDFCCTDPSFYAEKLVHLPNGLIGMTKRANFDFTTETLELSLLTNSECTLDVTYPTETEEENNCTPAGQLIRTERVKDTYYIYTGDPCDLDPNVQNSYGYLELEVNKFVYADGYCGEYSILGDTPTAQTYYSRSSQTKQLIDAQTWCNLSEIEKQNWLPYTTC